MGRLPQGFRGGRNLVAGRICQAVKRAEYFQLLCAGDEGAWERFVADYAGTVGAVAGRFGFSADDRNDLLQNTCLTALNSIRSLRDPDRMSSWVYSIAYRAAIDHVRRQARIAPGGTENSIPAGREPAEFPTIEATLELDEDIVALFEALSRMDGKCRNLLRALYLQDNPAGYHEVSEQQGMPVGSIGPTRARCLARLKTLMDDLSNRPPSSSTS